MPEPETLGLPSPSDDPTPDKDDRSKSDSATGRSNPHRVRSLEECLYALEQLAGMVAMGLISPGRTNAIRGTFRDIITVRLRSAGAAATAAPLDQDLLKKVRQDPQLMNLMEPFLTTEQIAALMKE